MTDAIGIFEQGDCYSIAFHIDGQWSPVTTTRYRTATWSTADDARAYLDKARRYYRTRHGDDLPWDIENIPVYILGEEGTTSGRGSSKWVILQNDGSGTTGRTRTADIVNTQTTAPCGGCTAAS
jgi:hypothetical protein